MALAKTTQDHDEIRQWAEARGGKPAVVSATEGKDETGIIRLMFPNAPNHNDDALEEIGWDEWFEKFDESGLELTYQEKTADGQTSDFNKLTYPDVDSAKGKALLKKSAGKKSAKSAGAEAPAKAAAKSAEKKAPAKKEARGRQKGPSQKVRLQIGLQKILTRHTRPQLPQARRQRPHAGLLTR